MSIMHGYAIGKTIFGSFIAEYNGSALTGLRLLYDTEPEGKPKPCTLTDTVFRELDEYFYGKRIAFDIPYILIGTDFQKKVWRALTSVPYGETRTYGDIARFVSSPYSARAVGMACNRNPIAIIVPCHRIVGIGGKLVGYAYGTDMKAALLSLETNVLNRN